jgi:hypothetical protein
MAVCTAIPPVSLLKKISAVLDAEEGDAVGGGKWLRFRMQEGGLPPGG